MHLDGDTLAALTEAALKVVGEGHPLTAALLMAAAGQLDSHEVWVEIERLDDLPRRLFAATLAEIFPAFAGPGDGQRIH